MYNSDLSIVLASVEMIQNPHLVYYACVAKGTTIVAELNSTDADLGALAAKCLENTPTLHSVFSHTVRNKTYTFLIDENFTYFAICDGKFEKSEGLLFLNSVKDSFNDIVESSSPKRLENVKSHCFQGEFNPVFHQLLASPDIDSPHSPRASSKHSHSAGFDSPKQRTRGFVPVLGDPPNRLKKKKKKKSNGDGNENKVDVRDDSGRLSREFSDSNGDLVQQKSANLIWKKQVVIVLTVDVIVCSILFGVWLWICRGFKCIDG